MIGEDHMVSEQRQWTKDVFQGVSRVTQFNPCNKTTLTSGQMAE